jgi:peptidoglycan hydrolase-like protein with peptidoglycan-binding domain
MTAYDSIVISSGHGLKIRGAAGDPSGSPDDPYLDEVDEARAVVDALAKALEQRDVRVVVFHDNTSTSQDQNLETIVSAHNREERQLDLSVHFNAYSQGSKCMGTEMLYITQGALADELSYAVAQAGDLIDRGPKKNTGLYFLNNTEMPSVLLEICFCDSSCDTKLYRENFDAIIDAMATVLGGEGAVRPPEPIPPWRPERPERPERPDRPPPVSAERPTLGKGDSGSDVVALQKSLGLIADGDFGSVTESQVIAFQRATDLAADGIVGEKTWAHVDELDRRMAQGDSGLPKGLAAEVLALAESSSLMDYEWPGRGVAPSGYIPGMALCYALAVAQLERDNSAALVMAEAADGDEDEDALVWYEKELEDLDLDVSDDGLETLRALFVILIGLGMRESSGRYCEGRDMSADNVAADTCEAGLFQMSANMHSASPEMKKLFDVYWKDPQGFLDVFREGISPTASNLDVYGSGKGASFQWLGKFSPAFAAFTTAVGLRKRKAHWGPIQRKEVTLSPAARDLLRKIEALVATV